MGKRNTAGTGGGSAGLWLAAALLVILVLVIVYWRPSPGGGAKEVQNAGELVTDERIIFGGIPRAVRPEARFEVLRNRAYMVGYSEERKDPVWSAYRVIRMEHPFLLERPKGNFLTDERTQARVTHQDFTGFGYDRGHMTPNSAIARCYGAEAQKETFLLSNICPQASALNRDVWEKLEKDEIDFGNRFGEVWVVDGPVFSDIQDGSAVSRLPSGISVPAAFFKIVVEDASGGKGTGVKAFAVIMPQGVKGTELPGQFLRSIKEVERQTGLEFLWKLDPGVRAEVDGRVGGMW